MHEQTERNFIFVFEKFFLSFFSSFLLNHQNWLYNLLWFPYKKNCTAVPYQDHIKKPGYVKDTRLEGGVA